MIDVLKLSWRKGSNYPTASELNSIISKINEIIRNGGGNAVNNENVSAGGSSFDWTSIPSVTEFSRGLMTPEYLKKIDNIKVSKTEITEMLSDVFVSLNDIVSSSAEYNTDEKVVTAGYADKYFVNNVDFALFKMLVPLLGGDNVFTGTNTFSKLVLGGKQVQGISSSNDAYISDLNLATSGYVSKYYLRNDSGNWEADGNYDFTGSNSFVDIHSPNLVDDDFVGQGISIYEHQGFGYIKTDNLVVRNATWLRNVTIEETKHLGGENVLSAAYCTIAFVEPYADENGKSYYYCFFEKKVKTGGSEWKDAYNMWEKGDQARLQQANAGKSSTQTSSDGTTSITSRFYWRVVVESGNGEDVASLFVDKEHESFYADYYYVKLSNNDIENLGIAYAEGQGYYGTSVPSPNDEIVLLGNRSLNPNDSYRKAAQVYSTIDTNSPSRRYYVGIGVTIEDGVYNPFSLKGCEVEEMEYDKVLGAHWKVGKGKNFIEYSDKDGLKAHLSSLKIIVKDTETDIGDALGENFKFITTDEKAKVAANGEFANDIDYSGFEVSRQWGEDFTLQEHIGDYLITGDGVTYEFVVDPDDPSEPFWRLTSSTDPYLLSSMTAANTALRNLDEMADDGVITPQEKLSLRNEVERLSNEVSAVYNDAVNANVSSNVVIRSMTEWFEVFYAIVDFGILSDMSVTTSLANLTVFKETEDSVPSVSISEKYDEVITSSPVGKRHNFKQCYTSVYSWLAMARSEINSGIMNAVNDIIAGSSDINKEVLKAVGNLEEEVKGQNTTITTLQGKVMELANNVVYTSPVSGETWNLLKGMVATENFATLFAAGADENGKVVTQADITAFITEDEVGKLISNISISADKIDFKGADISVFSKEFRIDAENFKIDKDGNVKMNNAELENAMIHGDVTMNDAKLNNAELNNALIHGFIYRDELVITPDNVKDYLLDEKNEYIPFIPAQNENTLVIDVRKTGSKIILQGDFRRGNDRITYISVIVPSLHPKFSINKEQLSVARTMVGEEMTIANNTSSNLYVRVFCVTKNTAGHYIVGQAMNSNGIVSATYGNQITIKCERVFAEESCAIGGGEDYKEGDEIIYWTVTKNIKATYHQPNDA